MTLLRGYYNLMYRYGTTPWSGLVSPELIGLVESGVLAPPGRVIDLGCGEGENAIFLARAGFDVTGVDFAPAAIAKARTHASAAGVDVEFLVDDLTRLEHVRGQFDLLVDHSSFDDLGQDKREAYLERVVPLARPGAVFWLWCFEWEPLLWERVAMRVLRSASLTVRPGEVGRRFSPYFTIERVAGETGLKGWPRGWAEYLMTRRTAAA